MAFCCSIIARKYCHWSMLEYSHIQISVSWRMDGRSLVPASRLSCLLQLPLRRRNGWPILTNVCRTCWIKVRFTKDFTPTHETVSLNYDCWPLCTGGKTPSLETSPVWIPDSDAKACMLCSTPFTVINRRVMNQAIPVREETSTSCLYRCLQQFHIPCSITVGNAVKWFATTAQRRDGNSLSNPTSRRGCVTHALLNFHQRWPVSARWPDVCVSSWRLVDQEPVCLLSDTPQAVSAAGNIDCDDSDSDDSDDEDMTAGSSDPEAEVCFT